MPSKTPVTWVKPKIKCEVKFSEITRGGIMRHPVLSVLSTLKHHLCKKLMKIQQ
ncbi:MAG: hypothetical protein HC905_17670 [Bacteroidales bacterium]|nr:hypothetical protein [Bacteroidales bacterium]